ncbi:hypothetical protein H4219_004808 [Mycoemilia scoparia]|uniref:Uncharacterized protein n=1 Tax=Mycoemilia scoparia TaxID=417184 RepID=A0A9W7ZRB6_9FUNG|nr:hypothetical protein H4219_004808 [Mycoemilia scoparia]
MLQSVAIAVCRKRQWPLYPVRFSLESLAKPIIASLPRVGPAVMTRWWLSSIDTAQHHPAYSAVPSKTAMHPRPRHRLALTGPLMPLLQCRLGRHWCRLISIELRYSLVWTLDRKSEGAAVSSNALLSHPALSGQDKSQGWRQQDKGSTGFGLFIPCI